MLLPDGVYIEDIGNELVKDILNDIKLQKTKAWWILDVNNWWL